ncbi:MAG: hypothetical protein H0S79_19875 [Anaerolineaceae bacterium]|nr:hypothetical protein [Anaerolineaceae bacterium]
MKTNRLRIIIIVTLLGLMLSACDGLLAQPTATPTATNTPQPTATVTATPAPTKTATPTATPTEEIIYPRLYEVDAGGYSFEIPKDDDPYLGLSVTIEGVEALIQDMSGELMIYFAAGTIDYEFDLDQEIQNLADGLGYEGIEVDPEPFEVAGHPARRAYVTTSISGVDFMSEFIIIDGGANQLIVISPSLFGDSLEARWDEEMQPLLDAVLDSFQIMEPDVTASTGECTVSTDSSYGYSEDNPVLVGGDWLEGPSRERAYLDNLRGPNGEMISYERVGSEEYGDTILDKYQITYSGLSSPITIYIDEYSWTGDLYAPVGLTCSGPFTLTAP